MWFPHHFNVLLFTISLSTIENKGTKDALLMQAIYEDKIGNSPHSKDGYRPQNGFAAHNFTIVDVDENVKLNGRKSREVKESVFTPKYHQYKKKHLRTLKHRKKLERNPLRTNEETGNGDGSLHSSKYQTASNGLIYIESLSNGSSIQRIYDIHKHERQKRSSSEEESSMNWKIVVLCILGLVVFAIVVVVIVFVIVVAVVRQNRLQKKKKESVRIEKPPRQMECADIYATKFNYCGALVLDPKVKGPVQHACDSQDTTTGTLKSLQFDPNLNEIVDIGSNVEVINENDLATTDIERTDDDTRRQPISMKNLKSMLLQKTARRNAVIGRMEKKNRPMEKKSNRSIETQESIRSTKGKTHRKKIRESKEKRNAK